MSRFYGTLRSERKSIASKGGVKKLCAHVRTWSHGIDVRYFVDDDGNTICHITETGGSDNPDAIKTIKRINLGITENKRPGSSYFGRPIGGA